MEESEDAQRELLDDVRKFAEDASYQLHGTLRLLALSTRDFANAVLNHAGDDAVARAARDLSSLMDLSATEVVQSDGWESAVGNLETEMARLVEGARGLDSTTVASHFVTRAVAMYNRGDIDLDALRSYVQVGAIIRKLRWDGDSADEAARLIKVVGEDAIANEADRTIQQMYALGIITRRVDGAATLSRGLANNLMVMLLTMGAVYTAVEAEAQTSEACKGEGMSLREWATGTTPDLAWDAKSPDNWRSLSAVRIRDECNYLYNDILYLDDAVPDISRRDYVDVCAGLFGYPRVPSVDVVADLPDVTHICAVIDDKIRETTEESNRRSVVVARRGASASGTELKIEGRPLDFHDATVLVTGDGWVVTNSGMTYKFDAGGNMVVGNGIEDRPPGYTHGMPLYSVDLASVSVVEVETKGGGYTSVRLPGTVVGDRYVPEGHLYAAASMSAVTPTTRAKSTAIEPRPAEKKRAATYSTKKVKYAAAFKVQDTRSAAVYATGAALMLGVVVAAYARSSMILPGPLASRIRNSIELPTLGGVLAVICNLLVDRVVQGRPQFVSFVSALMVYITMALNNDGFAVYQDTILGKLHDLVWRSLPSIRKASEPKVDTVDDTNAAPPFLYVTPLRLHAQIERDGDKVAFAAPVFKRDCTSINDALDAFYMFLLACHAMRGSKQPVTYESVLGDMEKNLDDYKLLLAGYKAFLADPDPNKLPDKIRGFVAPKKWVSNNVDIAGLLSTGSDDAEQKRTAAARDVTTLVEKIAKGIHEVAMKRIKELNLTDEDLIKRFVAALFNRGVNEDRVLRSGYVVGDYDEHVEIYYSVAHTPDGGKVLHYYKYGVTSDSDNPPDKVAKATDTVTDNNGNVGINEDTIDIEEKGALLRPACVYHLTHAVKNFEHDSARKFWPYIAKILAVLDNIDLWFSEYAATPGFDPMKTDSDEHNSDILALSEELATWLNPMPRDDPSQLTVKRPTTVYKEVAATVDKQLENLHRAGDEVADVVSYVTSVINALVAIDAALLPPLPSLAAELSG